MSKLKALVFDLDGTLVDQEGAERDALQALFEQDIKLDEAPSFHVFLRDWRNVADEYLQRFLDNKMGFDEQRILRFQKMCIRDRNLALLMPIGFSLAFNTLLFGTTRNLLGSWPAWIVPPLVLMFFVIQPNRWADLYYAPLIILIGISGLRIAVWSRSKAANSTKPPDLSR